MIQIIHKLLEIFLVTMSCMNLSDFLNEVFRINLGIIDNIIQKEFDELSNEVWYNTVMNKYLYFYLFTKNENEFDEIKNNFNITYSNEILEYLCIFHNDNCIYRVTEIKKFLLSQLTINDKQIYN